MSNPFSELYAGDLVDAGQFVELFQDVVVKLFIDVFQQQSTVLLGTQGSGKTMLMKLLDPAIAVEYGKQRREHPLQAAFKSSSLNSSYLASFTSINNNILYPVANRVFPEDAYESDRTAYRFSDYLSFVFLRDILHSLNIHATEGPALSQVGLAITHVDKRTMSAFCRAMASSSVWGGFFSGCTSVGQISNLINDRLHRLHEFGQFRGQLEDSDSRLFASVPSSLIQVRDALVSSGVLEPTVPLFICLDQADDVIRPTVATEVQERTAEAVARVLKSCFALRHASCFFKFASRKYAWNYVNKFPGLAGNAESDRTFVEVDMDVELRRTEHTGAKFFSFAEAVFAGRIRRISGTLPNDMDSYFGSSPEPGQIKRKGVRQTFEKSLGGPVAQELEKLNKDDSVAARLGCAFVLQKGDGQSNAYKLHLVRDRVWELPRHNWWRKERMWQAVFQVYASNAERYYFHGKADIVTLAGCNILNFLRICREIWSQAVNDVGDVPKSIPRFSPFAQGTGAHFVSRLWKTKLGSESGSDYLLQLADVLGSEFRNRLRNDIKMSYPGHTGISVSDALLRRMPLFQRYLQEACDYGVLFEMRHTSKHGDGDRSRFYLNPLLCPVYQLPLPRTKEPWYPTEEDIIRLCKAAGLQPDELLRTRRRKVNQSVLPLDESRVRESVE